MPGVAGTDPDEIDNLGRLNVDDDWTVLKWDLTHSAYLEPLINRAAWEDSLTPESSTLAHEVALSFRGQYAFDDRLIPHAEAVVGGLYSVRGYDETLAIGDTAYIGSAEYRYHVPRAFKPRPVPGRSPLFGKPFRFAPQAVYGRPDWDLILRTFVDVGLARINQAENYESDEDLVGAGVGAELQVKERFGVRVDYGRVFSPVGEEAEVGDGRFHVILTVLF
jgi:hemolysin activation/secretion protein